MASKRVKDGPHWVKAWISELSALTDQFRDIETGAVDFEALGREEYHFRMALSRRDFTNSERARKVWEDAVGNYQQRIKAASKDKNPQDAPNGNAGVDSKSATSCDQFTADGDTREGSLDEKSCTSADNCGPRQAENGDASHREAEDESATVSNPFALDMPGPDKGEQPRDSRGSGRYQPPSLGPEDGNLEVTTNNQNNGGADAVNSNTTVDGKCGTSAPLRPWKEMVEKSLGISETDKSGTGKGIRPPNPVPGLLRKRRAAGSPLKPGTDPYPAARSLPKSMAEVSDFACTENLDYDDCRLWWEQNFVERKGKDKDGKKITNWRGALIRFCASAKRKRESA